MGKNQSSLYINSCDLMSHFTTVDNRIIFIHLIMLLEKQSTRCSVAYFENPQENGEKLNYLQTSEHFDFWEYKICLV